MLEHRGIYLGFLVMSINVLKFYWWSMFKYLACMSNVVSEIAYSRVQMEYFCQKYVLYW